VKKYTCQKLSYLVQVELLDLFNLCVNSHAIVLTINVSSCVELPIFYIQNNPTAVDYMFILFNDICIKYLYLCYISEKVRPSNQIKAGAKCWIIYIYIYLYICVCVFIFVASVLIWHIGDLEFCYNGEGCDSEILISIFFLVLFDGVK
jgi:hypothetical protein